MNPPRTRARARPNMLTMAITLRVILSGRFTRKELLEATGVHDITAQRWVRTLRAHKLIHVADWLPDSVGRDNVAVYELGDKPDKKRRALTPLQRQQRYRANLKLKKEKADV